MVVSHGIGFSWELARKRIHSEFDAHVWSKSTWFCFLGMYDITPYLGRDKIRGVIVDGQRLQVKQTRWKTWEQQQVIVGLEEILPAIGILLKRHFKKVGFEGFNAWLEGAGRRLASAAFKKYVASL